MSVAQEYTLIIQWSEEDQLYLAYSPELHGCITHGRTYLEAAEMGVEAMELWCDVTLSAGQPLPLPQRYDAVRGIPRKAGPDKTSSRSGGAAQEIVAEIQAMTVSDCQFTEAPQLTPRPPSR